MKLRTHLLLLVFVSSLTCAEVTTCMVNVVDILGAPVEDAEVNAYECVWDYLTNSPVTRILCPPRKTDLHGRTVLTFELSAESQDEMIVVRKPVYALGWDILPRQKPASLDISIVLDKPLVLGGRVLDPQGRPLAGASVQAQPRTSKLRRLSQRPVLEPLGWLTVQTDGDGRFQFDCFGTDANADFLVRAGGSKTIYKFSDSYSCGYKTGCNDILLQLPEETALDVRVTDEQGRPAAGLTAVLRPDHRGSDSAVKYVPQQASADEKGRCVFENIPAGKHLLGIHNVGTAALWADKTVILDTRQTPGRQEVVVALKKGVPVQITMLDESTDKPIRDMQLALSQEPSDPNVYWFTRSIDTNADGKAALIAPVGQCRFDVWDDRYERPELTLPVFEKEKPQNLVFELTPTEPIAGVACYADRKPAAAVSVNLTWGAKVLTDAAGAFKCTYRTPGEGMCLIARDVRNNYAVIHPVTDYGRQVDLTLRPAKRLKGKIVDPDGRPIPAARVSIDFNGPGYLSDCCPEVLTAQDGSYEFYAIPADVPDGFSFRISVGTMNHGKLEYSRFQVQHESDKCIELAPVQMHPAELTLDGVVVDQDNTPVAGIPIFLHGKGQYDHSTVTDQNGRFQLDRLCKGELNLQAALAGRDDNMEPGFLTARAGDSDVKIIMGQRRTHVAPNRSLAGIKLPEMGITIPDVSMNALSDKPLLLFFWDFNQRPSRAFIKLLAAKDAILSENHIQVILLHVAPADKTILDKWLRDNGIAYPCGIVDEKTEEFQSRMGVQSMPWMILTDPQHTVTAEGFSVEELAQKLDTI